jgi:hypothetical protein
MCLANPFTVGSVRVLILGLGILSVSHPCMTSYNAQPNSRHHESAGSPARRFPLFFGSGSVFSFAQRRDHQQRATTKRAPTTCMREFERLTAANKKKRYTATLPYRSGNCTNRCSHVSHPTPDGITDRNYCRGGPRPLRNTSSSSLRRIRDSTISAHQRHSFRMLARA